jgi:hypothetical protein
MFESGLDASASERLQDLRNPSRILESSSLADVPSEYSTMRDKTMATNRTTAWGAAALLLASAALTFLSAGTAAAQYSNPYNGTTWNNPVSAMCDVMITNSIQKKMLEKSLAQKRSGNAAGQPASGSGTAAPPVAPKHELSASGFTPLGGRLVPDKIADGVAGVDPAQKQQLAEVFRQTLATYEAQVPKNNVAFAMGFLIAASLQVLSGKDVSDPDFEQLVRDLNDILAETPRFRQMDAKGKQTLYEVSVITGGIVAGLYNTGVEEKDAAAQQQAKDLAKSVLDSFGVKVN